MYVYIILKLDIRFFNVFILDLFFYFCFLFLYVYISITHYNYCCCIIVQSIIIHNTGGSSHKHVKGLSDRHIPATDIWYS